VRDRSLLYAAAFLRALATGLIGVLMGVYLAKLGMDAGEIGLVVGCGLAGGAAATFLATLRADRLGRRRLLMGLALAATGGGLAFAFARHPTALALAAFAGMLNGMGRDRGASLVVEQAILPGTAPDRERTSAFAWYNVLQDAGHALGALLAAAPGLLRGAAGMGALASLQGGILGYALLCGGSAVLYLGLSPAVEAPPADSGSRRPTGTGRVLLGLSALFALDSIGGGFLTTALVSYFFYERFGVDEAVLGPLFFGARVLNALSHLAASWLARRIGLVNTMVFTHAPSSLLLVTVAFAPSFPIAAALFLVREGLVEMDVPTRQSYVMAVVEPAERTFASGVTHLVRLSGWAVAPFLAGPLMQGVSLATPLLVGAAIKIAYDIALYLAFRRRKPPEEASRP
jgi:MFS family permease